MPRKLFLPLVLSAAAALLVTGVVRVRAEDVGHDVATRLLQEGHILSLSEIMKAVGTKVPGEVIEVELELEDGAYVYELKILTLGGKVQDIELDAATGNIVDIEDDD